MAKYLRASPSGEGLEMAGMYSSLELRNLLSTCLPEGFCGDEKVVPGEKSGPLVFVSFYIGKLIDS